MWRWDVEGSEHILEGSQGATLPSCVAFSFYLKNNNKSDLLWKKISQQERHEGKKEGREGMGRGGEGKKKGLESPEVSQSRCRLSMSVGCPAAVC